MTSPEVERLVAYEAIRQLVARYAVSLDRRDLDTVVNLFVADVRVGSEKGRPALRRSFETSMRSIGMTILTTGTHAIDVVDDDHASGIVYCACQLQDGDRWVHQAIVYDDTYRREAGTWYFVRRLHRLFYGADVGANPLGLPPANWPEHHTGRGTLPEAWESWQEFWATPPPHEREST